MFVIAALLRGINVGGRTVKMDRLKSLFEGMGFSGIRTYIQSGNVVFASAEAPDASLRIRIEKYLFGSLSFDVPVVLSAPAELAGIVAGNPFTGRTAEDGRVYVTILQEMPPHDAIKALTPDAGSADEYEAVGRVIYIRCKGGYHETVYSNHYFEKKLKTTATTRNIETMTKLAALAVKLQAET